MPSQLLKAFTTEVTEITEEDKSTWGRVPQVCAIEAFKSFHHGDTEKSGEELKSGEGSKTTIQKTTGEIS
jgi:hypothetical protein